MVRTQEWLDQNYPKEERENIKELKIRQKNLEGHLNLQDFVSLEFLDCSRNQLTSLDLSKTVQLKVVNIYDNKISRADYAKIDIFSQLINLQKLDLGYDIDKQEREARERSLLLRWRGRHLVKNQSGGLSETEAENLSNLLRDAGWGVNEIQTSARGIVAVVLKENDFFGSLEILKNCQNLEELSIEGQKNITGKLENLPSSVETFNCKGTFFQKELEEFGHNRNLKILRLVRENERLLETRIAEEGEIHREAAFSLSRTELAIKSQRIEELENQVKQLQRQNEQFRIQELENEPKTTEQLIEKNEQEIKILHEQLETKRQKLNNLKQKLLLDNCQTTESELNNLCQLQKELTYLEQQQNQIIETKILQVELPKF